MVLANNESKPKRFQLQQRKMCKEKRFLLVVEKIQHSKIVYIAMHIKVQNT